MGVLGWRHIPCELVTEEDTQDYYNYYYRKAIRI